MALKEHLIEAPAIVQRLDLLGVTARDGSYHVSVHNPGFHPIDVAPELQAVRDEDAGGFQSRLIQDGGIPTTLVLQVMHGIDDTGRPFLQEMAIGCAQVGGAGGGLPIVEVDNIGSEAKLRQGVEQAPAKEEKAKLLVVLIQAEVEPLVPAKKPFMVKQVDDDRRIGERSLQDRHSLIEPGHVERPHNSRRSERPVGTINSTVAGQKDAHVVPQSRKFFGQAPDDVGNAALFGKGNHLRCDHQYL